MQWFPTVPATCALPSPITIGTHQLPVPTLPYSIVLVYIVALRAVVVPLQYLGWCYELSIEG